MNIETIFYDRFNLIPDKKAMAVFVKHFDKEVNSENYEFRKYILLQGMLSMASIYEDIIPQAWEDIRKVTDKAYTEFLRESI